MSVFASYRDTMFPYRFAGQLTVGCIAGGTPTDPKVAEGWLRTKTTAKDDILRDLVAQTVLERGVSAEEALKIAVNLSVKQFERGSIVNMVADTLRDTGLDPARLQLEVTESVIMNTDDAMVFINDLHAIGVGLAIDDFGTGYSSLAYLKKLPVDELKIDKSFVLNMENDIGDTKIVRSTIDLGHNMGLRVVAEGVETAGQLGFLRLHGCEQFQGYLFGRPVPPDVFEHQHRHDQSPHFQDVF